MRSTPTRSRRRKRAANAAVARRAERNCNEIALEARDTGKAAELRLLRARLSPDRRPLEAVFLIRDSSGECRELRDVDAPDELLKRARQRMNWIIGFRVRMRNLEAKRSA